MFYETLDQAPDAALADGRSASKFVFDVFKKDSVGIIVSGAGEFTVNKEGYWGRSVRLETGDLIYLRNFPRGTIGKPLVPHQPRMLAFRRVSTSMEVSVGFAVLWLPIGHLDSITKERDVGSSRTMGCRSVQVLLPSLFNKHDARREHQHGNCCFDQHGFETVRAATFTIQNPPRKTPEGPMPSSVSVSPGFAYLVIAGEMAGVNVDNGVCRSTIPVSEQEHFGKTAAVQSNLARAMGEAKLYNHVSAAFTLLDLIGAEGMVSLPCNPLFEGALPDMMSGPMGMSFVVVMASRIACFAQHFGLASGTANDAHCNRELCTSFHSRWTAVTRAGCRAIDCAIKAGYDSAIARTKQDASSPEAEKQLLVFLHDNMQLWQRVGQRLNTMLASECRAAPRRHGNACLDTQWGNAEIFEDRLSDAKFSHWEKLNLGAAPSEMPIERIHMASRADQRMRFDIIQDQTEIWLREGMYNGIRIHKANVNVAKPSKTEKTGSGSGKDDDEIKSDSSSSSEDDVDQITDHELNLAAVESAAGASAVCFVNGSAIFHQFGMESFLIGKSAFSKCVDCDQEVGAMQSCVFGSKASVCFFCSGRRCFDCSAKHLRTMSMRPCGACVGSQIGPVTQKPLKSPNRKGKKGRL